MRNEKNFLLLLIATIRNVALTAPYKHNGVYETLNEVMSFYNEGGVPSRGTVLPIRHWPLTHST